MATVQSPGSTPVGRILPSLRFALFSTVLRSDVYVMHAVQRLRSALPKRVRRTLDKLVSAHPMYDLTLGLWLCIPWALYSLGWRLFWPLALNTLCAFLATWLVGGPKPEQLIDWLRPLGRMSPSGFPCIELQVATCLLTYVGWWYASPLQLAVVLPCAAALAALLALRLYALTHFPHQLLLSAAIGAASVPGCRRLSRYLFALPVAQELHIAGAFFIGCLFLGYICYYAETNEVPFARIPRAEFTRVLDGILQRTEQVSERDYRAAARANAWDAGRGAGGGDTGRSTSTVGSGSNGLRRRFEAAASSAGEQEREAGVGLGAAVYPPMGPAAAAAAGGGGGAGSSYPPSGPLQAAAGGPSGLNLGSVALPPRRDKPARVPRDSLYHLLKASSQR